MAKKKRTAKKSAPSKSQAIRKQLAKRPNATASEIAQAASKQVGTKVSPALVYNIKSTEGGTKRKRRRKKIAKRTTRAAAGGGVNAALIKEAAALLSHAGDPKAARAALAVAEDVSKVLAK